MKKKSHKIYSVCLLFSNRQQENLDSLPIWVWENNYLIKASSLDVAYKRAVQEGKEIEKHSYESGLIFNYKKGCQIFEGVVNVTPLDVCTIGSKLVINEKFYLVDNQSELSKLIDYYEDSHVSANFYLDEINWNLQKFSQTIKNKLVSKNKLVKLQKIFIISLIFEIKSINPTFDKDGHIIVISDVIIQGQYKNCYNEELDKFLKIINKNKNFIINEKMYEFKYLDVSCVVTNTFSKRNEEMYTFVDEYGYKEYLFNNELDLKNYLAGNEVRFLYLGNKRDFPQYTGEIIKIIKSNISKKYLIFDLVISFKLNYKGFISDKINISNIKSVNNDIKQLLDLFYGIDWPKWKLERPEDEYQEYEINLKDCI